MKALLLAPAVVLAFAGISASRLEMTEQEEASPPQVYQGHLTIVWADPYLPSSGDGGTLYTLNLSDGSRLNLHLAEPSADLLRWDRQPVIVRGREANPWQAKVFRGDRKTVVVDSIEPLSGSATPVGQRSVRGKRKIIFLLLKFKDDIGVPHAPSFYTDLTNPERPPAGAMFPATINGFFKKTSYRRLSWIADVGGAGGIGAPGGWLTLPYPQRHYAACGWQGSCADIQALSDDGMRLGKEQGIDFTPYDAISFVFSNDLDCCAWGGGYCDVAEGKCYQATWLPPWGQETGVLSHELGHGIGLPHSGWVYSAYDSPWDVMSRRTAASSKNCGSYPSKNTGQTIQLSCTEPGDGYIVAHKSYLGWLPPRNVLVTDARSRVSVDLEAAALPLRNGIKMIKICLPGFPCDGERSRYYTVEARLKDGNQKTRYDNGIPGDGVIIHKVRMGRPSPKGNCFKIGSAGFAWPIDSTRGDFDRAGCKCPENLDWDECGLNNAQLAVGGAYRDGPYDLEVRVEARTETGFRVSVSGGDPDEKDAPEER